MIYIRILALCALAALAACQPKTGTPAATGTAPSTSATTSTTTAPADSSPVAIVNGVPIERAYFEFYAKGFAGKSSMSEVTPEQRQQALDNLVHAQVVAQEARKEGVDKDPATAAVLKLEELKVLQDALSEKYLLDKKPTEQEERAEYETQVGLLGKQEYHVHQIQVATEGFARKLIGELEKGANFEELAKRESMDPSKTTGGDIGWLTPDHIKKPFGDAVLSLKKGEYTHKPVQTEFGWHIVRLDDVRDVTPPTFDQVRQRLEQVVQAKKFKAYTDGLIKNAQIEKKI
jgi:peptidyl-prolyl cis-trans isomerase C